MIFLSPPIPLPYSHVPLLPLFPVSAPFPLSHKPLAFREELEAIVESQIRNSSHPASLIALQHIAEMVLPPSCGKAFRKGSVGAGND